MLGHILALLLVLMILATFYILYRAAHRCHEGHGGILCKLWEFLA